jgi:hypothetical protein
VSQGPGRPGRLANPRLIHFPFISSIFSHFSLIWRRLASPYTRLGVSKGADRLTSPCPLKNIGIIRGQLYELANKLNQVSLSNADDIIMWKWTSIKTFSVKSVYEHLTKR